ncbi:MAG TPA: Mur ligase domain-containing protein, partial [Alphaproteobacteria bacterium]|nr:Mur ligase domain-containing protein [Alphaproteobacteria bacterium]
MRHIPPEIGTLHFIGIGGIGMSGIAEALASLGYTVQGSDIANNYNTERLAEKGIKVSIGQNADNLQDTEGKMVGAVIISSAIKSDNPELIAARDHKIPVVARAEMLAELMRLKWTVTVAGTHGKTTTTSLVGTMLESGDLDPTVINGGIVNAYGTN